MFSPLLLEMRILRGREVKGLGHITWVIYDKARPSIQPPNSLSQLKAIKHQMNVAVGYRVDICVWLCLFFGLFISLSSFPLEYHSPVSTSVFRAKFTHIPSSMGST